ncbi:acyl carrier protein [Butyrivibrio sp. AD3002]|uniref:acyl carrier protein n=1 Tax=Butyrivibrio sp. AD3002 TaxID=1280670 RepID=UPI0003B447B3|nr:acyl carrier protein [Butyrivibrio sp. AD3002]
MKEKVMEILKNIRDDIDFNEEKALIDDGILDSFDIIGIVTELNEAFGVDITADDLEPENFNSVDAMVNLINGLL